MNSDLKHEIFEALKDQPEWVIKRTLFNVERYLSGALISKYSSDKIRPISKEDAFDLTKTGADEKERLGNIGIEALRKSEFAYFIMAGGVATSMGGCIKAIVRAKGSKSFIQYKLDHIRDLQKKYNCKIPVILMVNRETDEPIMDFLKSRNLLEEIDLIKIVQPVTVRFQESDGVLKIARYADGKISYVPGGHYDSFILLNEIKDLLKERGIKTIFINNIDNLSASVDPVILGRHLDSGSLFSPEIVQKAKNEKGGVFVWIKFNDGEKLRLLEGPMVPDDYMEIFKDTEVHKFFNVNNIYLDIDIFDYFEEINKNVPVFINKKEFDGIKMFGFEGAIGLVFGIKKSSLIIVDRNSRFFPIKYLSDLWLLRSNFSYVKNGLVYPVRLKPLMSVSKEFLSNVDDLEEKVDCGGDSTDFSELESLEWAGDGLVGKNVKLIGNVKIENGRLKDNEIVKGN